MNYIMTEPQQKYTFMINPANLQKFKKNKDGKDVINKNDPMRPLWDFLLDNPNMVIFLILSHILVAYFTSSNIFAKCKDAANQCAEFYEANINLDELKKK